MKSNPTDTATWKPTIDSVDVNKTEKTFPQLY